MLPILSMIHDDELYNDINNTGDEPRTQDTQANKRTHP